MVGHSNEVIFVHRRVSVCLWLDDKFRKIQIPVGKRLQHSSVSYWERESPHPLGQTVFLEETTISSTDSYPLEIMEYFPQVLKKGLMDSNRDQYPVKPIIILMSHQKTET